MILHKDPIAFSPPNSDRTLNTHKTQSPKSQHQTAIAPQHPIAYSPNPNKDRPSPPTNPIAYSLKNQTAIAPHHSQTRSPIPQQTANAPHNLQNPIA